MVLSIFLTVRRSKTVLQTSNKAGRFTALLMTLPFHVSKVCLRILTSRYPYSKWELLLCYLRIIGRSVAYHKFQSGNKREQHATLTIPILGYTVHFTSYPQLISLLEEIFIFQVYQFNSASIQPLVIDCGSHLGISILYFKKLYPRGRFLAFEPNPETFLLLKANVENNHLTDVSLYNTALSDFHGKSTFYAGMKFNTLNSSLIKNNDMIVYGQVDTCRLSDFIEGTIDLLKIDVEGSETEIIRELIQSGKIKLVKEIIQEYHPDKASSSLKTMVAELTAANFKCRHNLDEVHPGATESIIYCKQTNSLTDSR